VNLRIVFAVLTLSASTALLGCGDDDDSPLPAAGSGGSSGTSGSSGTGGAGGTGGAPAGQGGGGAGGQAGQGGGMPLCPGDPPPDGAGGAGGNDLPVLDKFVCDGTISSSEFARTELFFGLSRKNGPNITEEQFSAFVDTVVTPRFPDGLTLLSGQGQFRGSDCVIIKEGSKLLILLHGGTEEESNDVEDIRTEYKNQFQQESVLRTDSINCVGF
jgi:Protein of unknown function (DUF3574)